MSDIGEVLHAEMYVTCITLCRRGVHAKVGVGHVYRCKWGVAGGWYTHRYNITVYGGGLGGGGCGGVRGHQHGL